MGNYGIRLKISITIAIIVITIKFEDFFPIPFRKKPTLLAITVGIIIINMGKIYFPNGIVIGTSPSSMRNKKSIKKLKHC